jgi:hypothetical protein
MDFSSPLLTQRAIEGTPYHASIGDMGGVLFPIRGRTCLIVDGSRVDAYVETGTQVFPFKTIQAALNAAMAGTTILITPYPYTENLVIPDLDGLVLYGFSDATTTVTNKVAGHTLSWVPAAATGVLVKTFTIFGMSFGNTDTTGTYQAIHVDGSAVSSPNTFCATKFELDFANVVSSGTAGQVTVSFRSVGQIYWMHALIGGGDVSVANCTSFRARQLHVGDQNTPTNFVVEYNGANSTPGTGRSDVTIAQESIVWGNVILNGHPIFQNDQSSIIVGNVTGTLTSYYSSGKDYCPVMAFYGHLGLLGGTGGSITLTLPDPQTSGTAFNLIDLSQALIQGSVSITKTNFSPATTRGYGVLIAPGTVFNTTTAGAISANGYVAMDLRGATFLQSALAVTGAASIDRSKINMKVATAGTSTAVTLSPPLPTGATYTVALTPPSAVAAGVSSETVTGFNILLATGGGTTDVTVNRI